jgi:hypothetical protein
MKSQKIALAAVATMSPALFGEASATPSSSTATVAVVQKSGAPDLFSERQLLKQKLLEMNVSEKLRVGGDRIRLAKSSTGGRAGGSTGGGTKPGKPQQMWTASNYCSGLLFV